MKVSIVIILVLLALDAALHAQIAPPSPLIPEQRDAEIRELRAELKSITMRLDALDSQGSDSLPDPGINLGGLFSGNTQGLKEGTLVLEHLFTPTFLARAEYRRDFSNQAFFLTDAPDVFVHAQTTATLGLVYRWGTRQG